MPKSVRFHPAALQDAEEAAAWLRRAKCSGGSRFLDELDRLIDPIPFFIVFRIDDLSAVVLAVAHGKRRPRFWQNRA